jgi:hypothetical protein
LVRSVRPLQSNATQIGLRDKYRQIRRLAAALSLSFVPSCSSFHVTTLYSSPCLRSTTDRFHPKHPMELRVGLILGLCSACLVPWQRNTVLSSGSQALTSGAMADCANYTMFNRHFPLDSKFAQVASRWGPWCVFLSTLPFPFTHMRDRYLQFTCSLLCTGRDGCPITLR